MPTGVQAPRWALSNIFYLIFPPAPGDRHCYYLCITEETSALRESITCRGALDLCIQTSGLLRWSFWSCPKPRSRPLYRYQCLSGDSGPVGFQIHPQLSGLCISGPYMIRLCCCHPNLAFSQPHGITVPYLKPDQGYSPQSARSPLCCFSCWVSLTFLGCKMGITPGHDLPPKVLQTSCLRGQHVPDFRKVTSIHTVYYITPHWNLDGTPPNQTHSYFCYIKYKYSHWVG